jgi:hypothetical protein
MSSTLPLSAVSERATFTPPYAPSWFDRLKAWVDGLPGPWWVFYLALGALLLAAYAALEWQLGIFPLNVTQPYFFLIATGIAYVLWLAHFIDRAGARALAAFRPALEVSGDAEYALLEYRLTTLPAVPALIASLLGVGFVLFALNAGFVPFQLLKIDAPPVWGWYNALIEIVLWAVIGMFGYHTLRQLALVREIYDERTAINVFRPGPLYALTGLMARTAIGLGIIGYGSLISGSQTINPVSGMALGVMTSAGVLLSFFYPLLGIHRRLSEEKERVLGESMTRLERLVAETQGDIDAGRIERAAELRDQTNAVQMQYQMLEKIPTWPWQPETIRVLISALLLPLVLFVVQYVIQQILTR